MISIEKFRRTRGNAADAMHWKCGGWLMRWKQRNILLDGWIAAEYH